MSGKLCIIESMMQFFSGGTTITKQKQTQKQILYSICFIIVHIIFKEKKERERDRERGGVSAYNDIKQILSHFRDFTSVCPLFVHNQNITA
jgi:hypothetical protein